MVRGSGEATVMSDNTPAGGGKPGFPELKEASPDFIARTLAVVRTIPSGKVMTYGDVAAKLSDHPDLAETTDSYGARLVGQVMARAGADVAWWRVIRSTGQPPKFHEKRALPFYEQEGTPLTGSPDSYKVNLKLARCPL
jgi:alkylated DNA nucleotide flippase Atl1